MDILWIVLGALLMIGGLVGSVLPFLPGPIDLATVERRTSVHSKFFVDLGRNYSCCNCS
jgi:hypothetical protein